MINRSSVFIPIVSPGNGGEVSGASNTKLIEVYSEPGRTQEGIQDVWSTLEHKAIDKYWDLIAAPLRVSSPVLYKSGCVAVSAVRKIQLKKPVLGVFQFFKPGAAIEAQRLYSVSVSALTEGNSAELGLAIALVTSLCNVQDCIIVATGALTADASSQSPPLIRQGDVKIHSVSQIKAKLAALELDITAGVFSEMSGSKKILVFTPKYGRQGDDEFEVNHIPEVQRLQLLGVTVIPVNWLSEVLSVLQTNRTQYLFQDKLVLTVLGTLLIVFMAYYSWVSWRDSHIPMAFVQVGSYDFAAEPFELCKLGKLRYPLPIAKASSIPSIPVASTIAWKTSIGDPNSKDAFLAEQIGYQGFYIIVIVVSEYSPVSFDYVRNDSNNSPLRIRPGDTYEGWIKLNEMAEVNILMILAQRSKVDIDQLRTKFNELFVEPNATFSQKIRLNVDAVSDFFSKSAPGTLSYSFMTVSEESKCVSQ